MTYGFRERTLISNQESLQKGSCIGRSKRQLVTLDCTPNIRKLMVMVIKMKMMMIMIMMTMMIKMKMMMIMMMMMMIMIMMKFEHFYD